MLLASLIIIYAACAIAGVSTIFIKKKSVLYFSLSALTFILLVVAGILSANYKNNFGSGFAIISIVSIFPLFLSLFEIKPKEIANGENLYLKKEQAEEPKTATKNEPLNKKKKFDTSKSFAASEGRIFESVAFLFSSFLLAFAGFYFGKATPFGILMCIPFAIIGIFVTLLRGNHNFFDIISNLLCYLSAGFLFGQIFAILAYSFALSNIFLVLAYLLFCGYILTTTFTKERRINIVMYVAYLLVCLAIIFM